MSILAWLIGSNAGRTTALIVLAALSAFLVVLAAFRKGSASERAKQTQTSLENLRTRIATDEEISRLPRAERRRRLSEWVSDDR